MKNASFEIIVQIEQRPLQRHVLGPGNYLIGRDSACPIPLDIPDVTFHHASLILEAGAAWIEDLGSGNGVVMDAQRIEGRSRLRLPAKIQLGSATLEIHSLPGSEAESPSLAQDPESPKNPPWEALRERRYQVGGILARGGMGAILQAQDLNIRRAVAMKVVRPERRPSQEGLARFIQEAQVMGQLEHPNIVPLHELGINAEGEVYYTMKLVKGRTLRQVLEEIRQQKSATLADYPLEQLLTIFQKICDAIAFAHSKGVIHRDLKPDNVMIGEYGEVLVMDWGLAKVKADQRISTGLKDGEFEAIPAEASAPLPTLEGHIMGTPHYMSPEQAEGRIQEIDERTDIFALGGILYHLLTLRPPVTGGSLEELLTKIRSGEIRPPATYNQTPAREAAPTPSDSQTPFPLRHCPGGRIPEALSAVAMKALAGDPQHRYQNVLKLQQDIAANQHGFATSAERAGTWKLLTLAIKRRKIELSLISASLLIIMAMTAGFTWKVTRTLAELRKAAPSFYADAQSLVEERKFGLALERIAYALSLKPGEANFHYLKGNIHQSLLQLDLARDAYLQALKYDVNHTLASENLLLCQRILSETKGAKALPIEMLHSLRMTMLKQQRFAEALAVAARIGKEEQQFLKTWQAVLNQAGVSGTLTNDLEGMLGLDLERNGISDLTPLRGMPLTRLVLTECTNVTNLKPLQGMPLRELRVNRCPISDLGPLQGMPLVDLWASETRITEINALKGMPLKNLVIAGTKVSDIRVLRGMPLENLNLWNCQVSDISPLQGMPLFGLGLDHNLVSDLRPLKGSHVRWMTLHGCPNLEDLTPLAECNELDTLTIPERAKSIEFLRRLPSLKKLGYDLPEFDLSRIRPAVDFWREYDARKK